MADASNIKLVKVSNIKNCKSEICRSNGRMGLRLTTRKAHSSCSFSFSSALLLLLTVVISITHIHNLNNTLGHSVTSHPSLLPNNTTYCIQHCSLLAQIGLITMRRTNCHSLPISTKHSISLTLLTIILSGDIQVIPGPLRHAQANLYPCGVCEAPLTERDKAIDCTECHTRLYISCIGIIDRDYETLHSNFAWICYKCNSPNFSNSFYEVIQLIFINSFSTHITLDTDTAEENEDCILQSHLSPTEISL